MFAEEHQHWLASGTAAVPDGTKNGSKLEDYNVAYYLTRLTCTCTRVRTHVHVHVYVQFVHVYMCTHMYMHMYMYTVCTVHSVCEGR